MFQELEGTLINTAELIAEQTSDEFNYNDFDHKPQINGVELIGNKTSEDLGIDIPTKTSELENDSGFITEADVPTKTSELQNDSGFITSADVPTKTSDLENDSGFITAEDVPTKTSELENDSGFVTAEDIPTKTSELQNDSNYVTNDEVESQIDELLPVDSASGSVASFSSALGRPLISLEAEIDYQAGGVSEVNIYQLGSNFFDKSIVTTGKLINGGGNEVSYAGWNVSDFIPVIEGASYYLYGLSTHPNTNQDNFELFDSNKTKTGFANVKTYDQPYVIPAGVKFIKFSLADGDMNTAQFGVSKNTIYEAYNALINKKTIDVSEYSVYGGYIDLTPTQATLLSTKNPDGTDKETPEVYPLEGVTDFNSQVGTNNILADSGDVSVTFKDSIQHYIDKKIAETQALIL